MEKQSTRLTARVRAIAPDNRRQQILLTYQFVLGREPTENEFEKALAFLELPIMNDTGDEQQRTVDLLAELALVLFNSAEFLYVD